MNKSSFEQEAVSLSTVSHASLKKAVREEELHLPISDPNIRSLKRHIYAAAGHVQGSDVSRNRLRSQLWSTAIFLGPLSLWITINPCDLHNPIVQIFSGKEVSMDRLCYGHTLAPNITDLSFHFLLSYLISCLD